MVKHARSISAKQREKRSSIKERMECALQAYRAELLKPDGEHREGVRQIASKFNVNYRTLSRHSKGGLSIDKVNENKQNLTVAEEKTLVQYILRMADWGLPLTAAKISMSASAFLLSQNKEPVGKNWVSRFIERHQDELQTHWGKHLDMQRAQCLNPTAVKGFYNLLEEVLSKYSILPENIYGMDESGIPIVTQGRQRVVGGRGTKTQHQQGSGDRENITAIVTICADGTALNPTLIFKGKSVQEKWLRNNVSDVT